MRRADGFNLVELVMIILAISVIGTFLLAMFTQLPRSLEVSEGAQSGSQLAQQCSERILARRRNATVGFTPIASGTCAGLPALAGYTVTDTVTNLSGVAPCPSVAANSCKRVVVTVARNAATVSVTDFMLVNY